MNKQSVLVKISREASVTKLTRFGKDNKPADCCPRIESERDSKQMIGIGNPQAKERASRDDDGVAVALEIENGERIDFRLSELTIPVS